eukprot:5679075-Pyramimonas_sp.AAC.1
MKYCEDAPEGSARKKPSPATSSSSENLSPSSQSLLSPDEADSDDDSKATQPSHHLLRSVAPVSAADLAAQLFAETDVSCSQPRLYV